MEVSMDRGEVINPPTSNTFDRALQGWLTDLPPETPTAVRVFFSSTFTDMSVERNLLMKEAVPYLRDYCQDRGLDYQVIDMRWGVREDATLEHTTTDVCLQEIENCQLTSAGPNFVSFLGDKYGSRLLPNTIPVTEFRNLRRLASWLDNEDFGTVDKWYLVDTNAVPPVYRIQSITALCPNYSDPNPKNRLLRQQHQQTWHRDQAKMVAAFHAVSQAAHERKIINDEEFTKYYTSVTHQEVNKGLVDSPAVSDMNVDTALSFHRTFDDIKTKDTIAKRFIDLNENEEEDTEATELRTELKDTVVANHLHPSRISCRTIGWTDKGVDKSDPAHDAYLKTFSDTFIAKMMQMIDKYLQSKSNALTFTEEHYREVVDHLRFCKQKCEVFCGRENELQKIQSLLGNTESTAGVKKKVADASAEANEEQSEAHENENDNNESQSGQVSQDMERLLDMCKLTGATFCYGDTFNDLESDPTRDLKEDNVALPTIVKFKKPLLIHGASGTGKTALMAKIVQLSKRWVPGSVCVVRFMGRTAMSTNIRNTLISVVNQISQLYKVNLPFGLDLSVDYHYLVAFFNALLWRIDTTSTPLFLIFDSIDQLQATDYAHIFTWLPKMVPPNVHFIISFASDHDVCLRSAQEKMQSSSQFIELGPLDRASADKMVRSLCHQAGRTLTAAQRGLVLKTYLDSEQQQALHLKLITKQSLSWRSHFKMSSLKLGDTIEAAVEQLFIDLEKTYGESLVSNALGYLTLSKHGLTDGEMEDILSLDDEVLQDTYIYHLPPDPRVIRAPSSLWVRLKSELYSYITEQVAGGRQVNTWYHRHFRKGALARYCTEDKAATLHQTMAEYFMGVWSTRSKPLELSKGKKGSYEDCLRGVPTQPLKFQGCGKEAYNIRKLQELPHHLANSDNWDGFHSSVACNVEFLVGVCRCLGVTTLLSQFTAMLSRSTEGMEKEEEEEGQQKVKDIQFVKAIIKLGVDDIRQNAINVPVQILGQLGPEYQGPPALMDLVLQSLACLQSSQEATFIPQNAFLPAPGGLLLSSISVNLFILGSDRNCGDSICLDEKREHLYVVEWNSNGKTDNLLTLDSEDVGCIITRDKLPFFIHSLSLVGKNKFFELKVYKELSKYQPKFNYMLFEGTLARPYKFDKPVSALNVASHGELIAFVYEDEKTVNIGTPDSKARRVQVKSHMTMDATVTKVLFSPDVSELVAMDQQGNILTYNTTQRQVTSLHTSTERTFSFSTSKTEPMRILKKNLLLRPTKKGFDAPLLSVMDLVTRQEKMKLTSDLLKYDIDLIELDPQEEFVAICTSSTGIVNGNTDKPALIWRLSDGKLSTVVPCQTSWHAIKLIGEETLYCLASFSNAGVINIFSCGLRDEPEREAIPMCELADHSKSVFVLLPIKDNTVLVSGAIDNTLKFWDLARILREKTPPPEDSERKKAQKKEEEEIEGGTDVETLGVSTVVAVSGLDSRLVYFGTAKGVVGYCRLGDNDDCGVQPVIMTSDLPPVHLAVLSRKGDYLMVAALNTVAVFDAKECKLLYTMPGLKDKRSISCLAEGGNTAALGHGGMEGKVKLWDLKTGDVIKEMAFLYSFNLTAINRSGTQVVASMFEYPLVMNIFSSEEEQIAGGDNVKLDKLDTLMTGLSFICISPDDTMVAACDCNGCTRVVSTENKYQHRLQQRSTPTSAIFTADSQQLLTSGYRSIYVWRMGTGQLDFKLTRHQDFVTSLRFALNDRYLISSSLDRSAAVWDFKSRATICIVRAQDQLQSVHLLPDLSRLVYIPNRVANVAVLRPNAMLQRTLEQGRRLTDFSDPETLENTAAFATVFNTQKDTKKNTSSACTIL